MLITSVCCFGLSQARPEVTYGSSRDTFLKYYPLPEWVSSAWCVLCTLIFYISPKFADVVNLWWFDSPMVLFELTLSFWLLFKGLKLSGEINA